jgi:DNA-binding NtrC family response regulator
MMPGDAGRAGRARTLRDESPDVPVVMMSGRAALADAVRATRLGRLHLPRKAAHPGKRAARARFSALELRKARRTAARTARGSRAHRRHGGRQPGHAGRTPTHRAGRADRLPRARDRGVGDGQGARRRRAARLASPRRDLPFVRVNCAAIPARPARERDVRARAGAFTGATERRIGRFELADTGTLLLDEVGDLSAGGAGEAAARHRSAGDRARRRRQAHPDGRADRRGDQSSDLAARRPRRGSSARTCSFG